MREHQMQCVLTPVVLQHDVHVASLFAEGCQEQLLQLGEVNFVAAHGVGCGVVATEILLGGAGIDRQAVGCQLGASQLDNLAYTYPQDAVLLHPHHAVESHVAQVAVEVGGEADFTLNGDGCGTVGDRRGRLRQLSTAATADEKHERQGYEQSGLHWLLRIT